MNYRPAKRTEAETRPLREKLLHLLYACSKDDREHVERTIIEKNNSGYRPLIFCTKQPHNGEER